ncbi:hypothetical protein TNCV_4921631 [Trichonephila clavipes]|nr:hypothetical protein TNCV_4921631 [Trichonephila clavipes]
MDTSDMELSSNSGSNSSSRSSTPKPETSMTDCESDEETKPIKVVVKGLPGCTKTDEIAGLRRSRTKPAGKTVADEVRSSLEHCQYFALKKQYDWVKTDQRPDSGRGNRLSIGNKRPGTRRS